MEKRKEGFRWQQRAEESFESGMPLEKAVADGYYDETVERAFKRKVSLTCWKRKSKDCRRTLWS